MLQARTGTTTTLYLFDAGTRPLAEYDSAWEYLLPDGLGSVRQLADGNGNVTLSESYEPYGSVLSSQGNATSAFGFSGEQTDSYTQLLFLRARYMQPTLGMFFSRDPWEGDALQPLTYNGWIYVEGNPVNNTDPTGICTGCAIGSLAQVAGADGDGGLKFRSYPDRRAPTVFPHRLSDGSRVTLLSDMVQGKDGLKWRWVSPFTMPTRNGFVADSYLVPISGPTPPPGGGIPPIQDLSGFKFGLLFRGGYRILTEYGSPYGFQQWLPDLGRKGHNGVDLVPTTEVPGDPCKNIVLGREVLSPVNGTLDIYNPDGSLSDPASNPAGITLDIQNILGYPDLRVQLTHVYPSVEKGPVQSGALVGYYAQIGSSNYPHVHLTMFWKKELHDPTPYLP